MGAQGHNKKDNNHFVSRSEWGLCMGIDGCVYHDHSHSPVLVYYYFWYATFGPALLIPVIYFILSSQKFVLSSAKAIKKQWFSHKSWNVPNLQGFIPLKGTFHSRWSFLVVLSRRVWTSQIWCSRICTSCAFGDFPISSQTTGEQPGKNTSNVIT